MTVIKNNQAASAIKEAIVLDLGDVARQAQKIRAAAEAKARAILDAASRKAAAITRQAHDEGFKQGHSEGLQKGTEEGRQAGHAEALQQAQEQLEQIQQSWLNAADQWEAHRHDMQRQARRAVVAFAVRFAEKIVHREIQVNDAVIADQVAAALAFVLRQTDVTIQICPDDRPILEQALPKLRTRFTHLEHLHLVDDPAVSRGGCVVGYGQGRIDASIDTQLQRLVELMMPNDTQPIIPDQGPSAADEPAGSSQPTQQPPPVEPAPPSPSDPGGGT